MPTATRKTDLTPLEAIVVEHTLGEEARRNTRDGALARIQRLTRERQKLYAKSAAHPLFAPANRARIIAISAEIELLWDILRRERATRRVQIERALNVACEDDDNDHREPRDPSRDPSSDAA
ncbi:MAG TPA: hypothetical protein VI139_09300 [Gemmatimonadales bacterium]|jgi:Protein of unknown function (DUF2630)